jgi:acetyl esterase/lipase
VKKIIVIGPVIILAFFLMQQKMFAGIIPTYKNVDYVGRGDTSQFMDIYVPRGANKAPLVIFIHGGYWSSGSKGQASTACDSFYYAGYVVADINYRLSKADSIWPAQIYDCKAAVRFLKANAVLYGIDTCAVGVIGKSAGGHLAALLGTSFGSPDLEGSYLGNANVSSKVHAVIDLYGVSDFLQIQSHISSCKPSPWTHCYKRSPEVQLLGCDSCTACPLITQSTNPMTYIDASDPSFFIMHGDSDCTIPWHQSYILDSALKANHVSSTFTLVKGKVHADPYFFFPAQKSKYLTFLNSVLHPCITTTSVNDNYKDEIKFEVFPNPCSADCTIKFKNYKAGDEYEIVLYDSFGSEIKRITKIKTEELPLRNIPTSPGIYFLKAIKNGQKIETEKLIIE